jgi:hypothetical protein
MKLGDEITITQVYHRRERTRWNERSQHHETLKVWEPWTVKPRPAIFLGWRTLVNGVREWYDPEVGNIFIPDKDGYIKAALVCFSTRENPVYAPVDNLEPQS